MYLENYQHLKNNESYKLVLIILLSILARIPIILLYGDTGLENEWKVLVNNLIDNKILAFDYLNPELDEFLFGLEIGKLSEPMSEQNGQVVYMISEKADAREIDYDDRESLKTHALQEWLDEQWDKYDIETNFTSDDYAWVTKQLGI